MGPFRGELTPNTSGGLAVPCIQTELITVAATADGHWAATASSGDLLIGDCLWGSAGSIPPYITPCWNEDKHLRYLSTPWKTGYEVLGILVARHVRQDDVRKSSEEPYHLLHGLR